DVLDVKPDLQVFTHPFHRRLDLSQHLMFAFIKKAVPNHNFRIFRQDPPELDEVAIRRTLSFTRRLNKTVELCISFARSIKIDAVFTCGFLVIFTETSHARGGDALGMTGAERIEQRAITLVEKQDAI